MALQRQECHVGLLEDFQNVVQTGAFSAGLATPDFGSFFVCGLAIQRQMPELAALAYVAFRCYLCTGEELGLCCSHVRGSRGAPVLVLTDTKTSKRRGHALKFITVEGPAAIVLLEWLSMRVGTVGPLWRQTPAMFRSRW